jgi:hypothetical protein
MPELIQEFGINTKEDHKMKKTQLIVAIIFGLFMVIVLLAACSELVTEPSEIASETNVDPLIPGPMPTDRVPPNKTYYRKRCWPACHFSSAWVSKDPILVTSEFDSVLDNDWIWINENPEHWSLNEHFGALRVVSHTSSAENDWENLLIRDAPSGYFDVVTQVSFTPTADDQKAGILIQLEEGGMISISRGYCQDEGEMPCVGDGIYFGGKEVDCKQSGLPTTADTVNLMLRKAGNDFVAYYCVGDDLTPEAPWVEVGRCHVTGVKPTKVGLFVTGGDPQESPETPADFELVTLVERK